MQTVGGKEHSALQTTPTLLTAATLQTAGEREHSNLTDNTIHCYADCCRKRAQ